MKALEFTDNSKKSVRIHKCKRCDSQLKIPLSVNFAAESWMNLVRPFLGTFLDKFEVYGTQSEKWKPKLLRHIPANQLSPKYGGSEDWKCLPAPGYKC